MKGSGLRAVLTIAIDIAIVVAVAVVFHLIFVFTRPIAHQSWALAYDALVGRLVIPFGARPIATPYGGIFDIDGAGTVLVALLVDWGLSVARDRA